MWFDSGQATWPESPSPHTAVGAVIGTAGYMSPEQARGRPVDFRSDQFTLGAILYELATGRQAFRRESPAQTIAAIIEDAPEPLTTRNPALPGAAALGDRALPRQGPRRALRLDARPGARAARRCASGSRRWPPPAARPPASTRLRAASSGPSPSPCSRSWRSRSPPGSARPRSSVPRWRSACARFRRRSTSRCCRSARRRATPEDRALADGVVELLTVRLAQLERFRGALWVEPSASVLQAGVTSAERAGRALGVTLVVTGSVQRLEGRLVLTATLEDARRNRALRAVTASGPDALVDAVVSMLALELDTGETAFLHASASGVAEASTLSAQALGYAAYSEGRSALERYDQSQRLERAIGLFNRALEQDPRYALAHAGLGEAYWRLYLNERRPDLVPLAEQHCERALALDDLLSAPWITLGMIHAGTGRADQALLDLQKALDRDPRNPSAYRERGSALAKLGRFEEAEATYRKAIELRPELWSNHSYLGGFLYGRGRMPEAEAAFRAALALAPENARVLSNLGGVLHVQGRLEEAESYYRQSLAIQAWSTAAANLAALQFDQKRYAEAARTLEQAVAGGTRNYRTWQALASARYWAPGERDKAARRLRARGRARGGAAARRPEGRGARGLPRRLLRHARRQGQGAADGGRGRGARSRTTTRWRRSWPASRSTSVSARRRCARWVVPCAKVIRASRSRPTRPSTSFAAIRASRDWQRPARPRTEGGDFDERPNPGSRESDHDQAARVRLHRQPGHIPNRDRHGRHAADQAAQPRECRGPRHVSESRGAGRGWPADHRTVHDRGRRRERPEADGRRRKRPGVLRVHGRDHRSPASKPRATRARASRSSPSRPASAEACPTGCGARAGRAGSRA